MTKLAYQYVVLRCVPRVDREEFVNVGVVVHCQAAEFLGSASHLDRERLTALSPAVDVDQVGDALAYVADVCAGDPRAGAAGVHPLGQRFGFVRAPRSTVLQPGPVHGGLTSDPAEQLTRLLATLVHQP